MSKETPTSVVYETFIIKGLLYPLGVGFAYYSGRANSRASVG